MPLPFSLTLLLAAIPLSLLHGAAYGIIAVSFLGVAIVNEGLRVFATRSAPGVSRGEYTIPPRTRTPITWEDGIGGGDAD